ncbi:uncharacterized protein LAESUDRAFT_762388 [Laetiporus sulphureus 93-53]|uniref:Uncharacterized protein n=1 Tax=Laetiporus sulphureus 93-53 TaxID=1314785 RepID=A0A165CKA7_9APHY|nr:uncharacterized protein LAESUDRAFT_762388 [Laetiporus sulphureus 93-53]KZT02967.1 hypothetical protein LAESUDRAFT_762388 [Laetiporus sulphureus 93-53]
MVHRRRRRHPPLAQAPRAHHLLPWLPRLRARPTALLALGGHRDAAHRHLPRPVAVLMSWNLSIGALITAAILAGIIYAWHDFRVDLGVPFREDDRQSIYLAVTKMYLREGFTMRIPMQSDHGQAEGQNSTYSIALFGSSYSFPGPYHPDYLAQTNSVPADALPFSGDYSDMDNTITETRMFQRRRMSSDSASEPPCSATSFVSYVGSYTLPTSSSSQVAALVARLRVRPEQFIQHASWQQQQFAVVPAEAAPRQVHKLSILCSSAADAAVGQLSEHVPSRQEPPARRCPPAPANAASRRLVIDQRPAASPANASRRTRTLCLLMHPHR